MSAQFLILEGALNDFSVLPQFLYPLKTSEFVLQPHLSYHLQITFAQNCAGSVL